MTEDTNVLKERLSKLEGNTQVCQIVNHSWKLLKDRIWAFRCHSYFGGLRNVLDIKHSWWHSFRLPRALTFVTLLLFRWWAQRRRQPSREPMLRLWQGGGRESGWLQTFLTQFLSPGPNLKPVYSKRLGSTPMSQLGLKCPDRSLKLVAYPVYYMNLFLQHPKPLLFIQCQFSWKSKHSVKRLLNGPNGRW